MKHRLDPRCETFVSGGHLADIPKPHRRRFPLHAIRKQLVAVEIYTWRGITLGAHHYYLDISEEANPIWDSLFCCWRCAWDDKPKPMVGQGRVDYHRGFETRREVLEFAMDHVLKNYPDATHRLNVNLNGDDYELSVEDFCAGKTIPMSRD